MKRPTPPKTLQKTGRTLWKQLLIDFQFEDAASLELLGRACMAADRAQQAREALAEHGPIVNDRFGVPQRHPAVVVERDSTATLVACFKLLGLHEQTDGRAGRKYGT